MSKISGHCIRAVNYQHLDIESVELSLMKPDGMSSEIPGIGSLRNDTATFAESGLE